MNQNQTKQEVHCVISGNGQKPPCPSLAKSWWKFNPLTLLIMTTKRYEPAPEGYEYIFRPWKRLKDGTIIYPTNGRKFFRFLVKIK